MIMSNEQNKSTGFSKGSDANRPQPPGSKTMARSEISAKWSRFTANDVSALKGKDDLISQVVSKYGMEKPQAQREVDSLMKGRHFE
jgi:hypothetical protein